MAHNIVILTGAGISKESGLSTFRDADGIWAKVRIEDVATPDAFERNPDLVHDFYNQRREQLVKDDIKPNPAHLALAKLEQHWAGNFLIVTQNIDNLHEAAGSENVLHMHGELLKARCNHCHSVHVWRNDLGGDDYCPSCQQNEGLRPHVVWFGEMPLGMDQIYDALEKCDLFISIGTSGNVYPAAGFVQAIKQQGRGQTLELNLEPSEGASLFDNAIYGPASEIVPRYVEELLNDHR